jgi:hypothetical protein
MILTALSWNYSDECGRFEKEYQNIKRAKVKQALL